MGCVWMDCSYLKDMRDSTIKQNMESLLTLAVRSCNSSQTRLVGLLGSNAATTSYSGGKEYFEDYDEDYFIGKTNAHARHHMCMT